MDGPDDLWDGHPPDADEVAALLHPDYPPLEDTLDDDAYLDHYYHDDNDDAAEEEEEEPDEQPPLPPLHHAHHHAPPHPPLPPSYASGGVAGGAAIITHHHHHAAPSTGGGLAAISALSAAVAAAQPLPSSAVVGGGGAKHLSSVGVASSVPSTMAEAATTTAAAGKQHQPPAQPCPHVPPSQQQKQQQQSQHPTTKPLPGKVVDTGNEHTGRWTKEEHEAFLTGLQMYGKEWKKVAARVKTRTVVQTRTHAQKYFQKLTKGEGGGESDTNTGAVTCVVGSMLTIPLGGAETPVAQQAPSAKIAKPVVNPGGVGGGGHPSTEKKPKKRVSKMTATVVTSSGPSLVHSSVQNLQMQQQMHHQQQNLQQYQPPVVTVAQSSISRSYSSEAASGLMTMFNDRRVSATTLGPPNVTTTAGPSSQQQHGFPTSANATIPGDALLPAPESAHGFGFANNNAASNVGTTHAQPLVVGGISIKAPTYDDMIQAGKFPEPSPAACGKRKIDEIAAAQMLAGVVGLATDAMNSISNGDVPSPNNKRSNVISGTAAITSASIMSREGPNRQLSLTEYLAGVFEDEDMATPPPPPAEDFPPNSPFSAAAAAIADADFTSLTGSTMVGRGLALQIVNPDSLAGHGNGGFKRRFMNGQASPLTPWDGQLEALVSQVKSQELHLPPPQDSLSIADEAMMLNEAELESLITPVILPLPLRNPRSNFQLAIFRGSVAEVTKICSDLSTSKSPLINQRDEAGFFPLHAAVALGLLDEFGLNCRESLEICQVLIDNGADVMCRDKDGNTPVHWASRAGHSGVLGLLLVRNCPLDVQNNAGETALHWAMRAGERGAGAAKVLVENGARVNVFNRNFRRPLDVAAEGFVGLHEGSEGNSSAKNDAPACCIKPDIGERRTSRWNLMKSSSQCRTLVLYHQECLDHLAKSDADWEVPDRIENIMSTLTTRTTESCIPDDEMRFKPCELTISNEFERATLELLSRIHSAEYLAFINDLSKELERKRKQQLIEGTINKDGGVQEKTRNVVPFTPMVQRKIMKDATTKEDLHSDTAFSAGSLKAARRAAGAVQHAVDCVLVGRNRNAFCIVRPPGHHAGINGLLSDAESCGFCLFNNVAAGAMHALSDEKHRPRCERCAIVDIDAHHGNGTEEIVRKCHDSGRLLFFSVHLYDHDKPKKGSFQYKFYPGTGAEDEFAHNIINVPLAPLWREKDVVKSLSLASNGGSAIAHPRQTRQTRQRSKEDAALQKIPSIPDLSKYKNEEAVPDSTSKPVNGNTSLETASVASDIAVASDSSLSSKPRTPLPSASPHHPPHYLMGVGRLAYRRAILHRLLPALRAFNPDLIILSTGFDAARGDVGNARHYVDGTEAMGLDLEPEDYAWTARKVCEIADICCNGRVVSVLEGGYGRTPRPVPPPQLSAPAPPLSGNQPASASVRQKLDKSFFSECAIQHLKGLVDPYYTDEQQTDASDGKRP